MNARKFEEALILLAVFFVPQDVLNCLDEDISVGEFEQVLKKHKLDKDRIANLMILFEEEETE